MKKGSFLRRILTLVIGTIVLYGVVSILFFLFIANNRFINMQSKELKPSVELVSDSVLKFQQGQITNTMLSDDIANYCKIWNAVVYVYDSKGNIIVKNQYMYMEKVNDNLKNQLFISLEKMFKNNLKAALGGKQVDLSRGPLLILGEPVVNNGKIIGAVFLTRPPQELRAAMLELYRTTILSAIGVFLIMLIPVYLLTKRIIKPVKEMRDAAIKMANGELNAHADVEVKGEIGELGNSLNFLSDRLSETISALQVERNRLKQTIDGLSEGILAIDTSGNITHANPAILNILGISKETRRIENIPIKELDEDFEIVLTKGYTIAHAVKWNQVVLKVTICPLEDEIKNIAGAVGLFQDITESERLEQTRRDYVANVSHELRTPLSSLRALAETLSDGMVQDDETKKRYYGFMLRETMRLSRLINDLLTLSRLQSDTSVIKQEDFNVNDLLKNISDQYSLLAKEKGISFTCSLLNEDVIINSSIDFVEQILIILLDNAIKYTNPKGTITLTAENGIDKVKISITDTGIGISPEDLPHIFERFYKADKAHATPGTGLGLAIAKEIADLLDEEIQVESAPGAGSKFIFTLTK